MSKNKLYNTIDELLRDTKELASISATIRWKEIKSRYIDEFIYPIGGSIIELKRDYTKSLKESFAAAFINNLYMDNEWDKDVLDAISKDEWKMYLNNIWIPKYFDYTYFKGINQYVSKDALKLILGYMLDGGLSESEYKLINKQYKDMEIVMIRKGCCDYVFVGANDEYFIYSECGIYD